MLGCDLLILLWAINFIESNVLVFDIIYVLGVLVVMLYLLVPLKGIL